LCLADERLFAFLRKLDGGFTAARNFAEVIELKYLELESHSSQHRRYFWRLPQEADGAAGCVRPDTSACSEAFAD
jgi:hypothetical protein